MTEEHNPPDNERLRRQIYIYLRENLTRNDHSKPSHQALKFTNENARQSYLCHSTLGIPNELINDGCTSRTNNIIISQHAVSTEQELICMHQTCLN